MSMVTGYLRLILPFLLLGCAFSSSNPMIGQWPDRGRQQPLMDPPRPFATAPNASFFPIGDLSLVCENEFTTLKHPTFPKHQVRIKRSSFCDESGGGKRSYTGYIDVGAHHLFFYFFESRHKPEKDDVVFWTNGGPGGSSTMGLLMELGPCNIINETTVTSNPHSWNNHANVFFIDQPIGVGYSYADYGEAVTTTEEAAVDIAAFVFLFFEHFTKFKGRPFHLAGESFAGRYLPIFAAHIYDQNALLEQRGLTPINLKSVMVGNGYTHPPLMTDSYYDMACTSVSVPPILSVQQCVRMKQVQLRCRGWLKKTCVDTFDALGCQAASDFCLNEMMGPVMASGYNVYDISRKCEGDFDETLCYPISSAIERYLNRPEIRDLIGIDPSFGNFTSRSARVGEDFSRTLDELHTTDHHVAALLEHGIRVLIYVGANDWICNHVGNAKWVAELDWSGKEGFASETLREWKVEGSDKKAGVIKSFKGLTFMTLDGAGHMVPHDKPVESLWMLNKWLAEESI